MAGNISPVFLEHLLACHLFKGCLYFGDPEAAGLPSKTLVIARTVVETVIERETL